MPICSAPEDERIITFDPSTSKRISTTPTLRDFWEETMVDVRNSRIPGAGEGLFAKQDIPEGIIFALFQVRKVVRSFLTGLILQ
jgi:hypothetical protein